MHSILASLSVLFKSGYLFIQSVPAKFQISRPVLGDFALFLSLPSLRHMAQVPIAPLAADIQAVLQEPLVQPDAQPDAQAVQTYCFTSRWSSTSAWRPTCGCTTRCSSPRSRSGSTSWSTRIDRFDIFLFDFLFCASLVHALSRFNVLLSRFCLC